MPATYTLIASNTLSSSAASVTFSSIPATYTDLVCRISVRSTTSSATSYLYATLNSDTGTNYSMTALRGDGSAAASTSLSNYTKVYFERVIPAGLATTNTFGSVEMYIPNYTSTVNKPISTFGVSENNAASTGVYIITVANLYRNSTAITSIEFTPFADNFASGSSFFLYGIKNS